MLLPSITVDSPAVTRTADTIESTYEYLSTEIVPGEGGAFTVKPTKTTYAFKTDARVPKVGCVFWCRGWGTHGLPGSAGVERQSICAWVVVVAGAGWGSAGGGGACVPCRAPLAGLSPSSRLPRGANGSLCPPPGALAPRNLPGPAPPRAGMDGPGIGACAREGRTTFRGRSTIPTAPRLRSNGSAARPARLSPSPAPAASVITAAPPPGRPPGARRPSTARRVSCLISQAATWAGAGSVRGGGTTPHARRPHPLGTPALALAPFSAPALTPSLSLSPHSLPHPPASCSSAGAATTGPPSPPAFWPTNCA